MSCYLQSAQNSSWHIVSAVYMLLLLLCCVVYYHHHHSIRISTLPFSVGEIETRNCSNLSYIMLVTIFCFD